jgi:hypothetical protein
MNTLSERLIYINGMELFWMRWASDSIGRRATLREVWRKFKTATGVLFLGRM